uniref:lipopolysaccharide kinase InaA family protein n=1 Tax=Halomonas sp. TaxID=1486246 RepID=UPI002636C81E|nr:lipopolysaccharide kinase InaA family protein [Halomonas sp.]
MKLLDIPFNDRRRRYLVFHPRNLPERLALASTTTTQAFEAVGSSRFYTSQDGKILAKVVPDKFSKRQHPLQWLTRDYLEKRWFAQSDARKEYLSMRILHRTGLRTPRFHGWGLSLNPVNRNASLLLMERIEHAQMGGDRFREMDEPCREQLLDRVADEVLMLAKAGYLHRDLHLNNLLVTPDNELIWVDAHLRRMPNNPSRQWPALLATLSPTKLYGEPYRQRVETRLKKQWSRI